VADMTVVLFFSLTGKGIGTDMLKRVSAVSIDFGKFLVIPQFIFM